MRAPSQSSSQVCAEPVPPQPLGWTYAAHALALAFFLCLWSLPSQAARLALLIGNDSYRSVGPLVNARNDARLMAQTLQRAGFDTTLVSDLDRTRFWAAIDSFKGRVQKGDEIVFYFAGHGVQIGANQLLLPVDIIRQNERQVERDGVSLVEVQDALKDARFAMFVIDACRDNPFPKIGGRSVGGERGLLPPEPATGQVIVMAAGRNQAALDRVPDNAANNGLFTYELAQALQQPGVDVRALLETVKERVDDKAKLVGHEQRPSFVNDLRGNFYFFGPTTAQVAPPAPVAPAAPAAVTADREERFWEDAKSAGNQEAYEAYLESYPKGRYASLARANLARLNAAKAAAQKLATDAAAERANKAEQERRAAEEAQKAAQRAASERLAAEAAAKEQQRLVMQARAKEQARLALLAQEQARVAAEAAAKEQQRLAVEAQAKEQARLDFLAQEQARVAAEAAQKLAAARLAELPQPGQIIKDCADCPELMVIPPGSFTMGSSAAEQALANAGGVSASFTSRESPQHSVNIRSFAAARYAMSKGEFAAFVRAKGYQTEAEQGDGCHAWNGKEWKKERAYNWRNVGFTQADSHPVVCVSWNDAQAYIGWLNQSTGKTFRLLSESEREYVARAGTQSAFWWGDSITTSQTNYDGVGTSYNGSPKGEYRQATVPVNSFNPNPFGLYNVHGNVWEWVEDCFHDTYSGAPTDGSAWTAGCSGNFRVLRGGSWYSNPAFLRSAIRFRLAQDHRSDRYFYSGFRLARTLLRP